MTTPDPEVFLVTPAVQQVVCNGGSVANGHPKVWYTFDGKDTVTCGYCDRVFTKQDRAGGIPYRGDSTAA